jgi:hypothetical protein
MENNASKARARKVDGFLWVLLEAKHTNVDGKLVVCDETDVPM